MLQLEYCPHKSDAVSAMKYLTESTTNLRILAL
jgi:hypothetical protein